MFGLEADWPGLGPKPGRDLLLGPAFRPTASDQVQDYWLRSAAGSAALPLDLLFYGPVAPGLSRTPATAFIERLRLPELLLNVRALVAGPPVRGIEYGFRRTGWAASNIVTLDFGLQLRSAWCLGRGTADLRRTSIRSAWVSTISSAASAPPGTDRGLPATRSTSQSPGIVRGFLLRPLARQTRCPPISRRTGDCTCSGRTPSPTNRAVMPCSQGTAVTSRSTNGAFSG